MATIENLKAWIERDITRYSSSDACVEVARPSEYGKDERFAFRIYTDLHRYTITARNPRVRYRETEPPQMPDDRGSVGPRPNRPMISDEGYLGCTSSSRKPRAGEDWRRGNDLADGPLTEETWHRILGDIVSYEMVRVHRPKPAVADDVAESP